MSGTWATLCLPPTPAAIAAYFTQRRSVISEFTPADIEHNERLWVVGICGMPEPPECAVPASPETENGGSEAAEVIPAVQGSDPRCSACGRAFQPQREWSRYCSASCKQRAKRRRRVA
jgi:hypothetical protein